MKKSDIEQKYGKFSGRRCAGDLWPGDPPKSRGHDKPNGAESPPPRADRPAGLDDAAIHNKWQGGAELLDEVNAFLGRFVAYPTTHAQDAHTLWIAHTHLMDAWESTPRLAFLSPEPASGKTRALEASEPLVPRPVEAVNVSPAYQFRKVADAAGRPTILFDEIDTVFGPRPRRMRRYVASSMPAIAKAPLPAAVLSSASK